MKKIVISIILLMVVFVGALANLNVKANGPANELEDVNTNTNLNYTSVLNKWKNEGVVDSRNFIAVVAPFDFIFDE